MPSPRVPAADPLPKRNPHAERAHPGNTGSLGSATTEEQASERPADSRTTDAPAPGTTSGPRANEPRPAAPPGGHTGGGTLPGEPEQTDAAAPPLPKRQPQTHIAPQLTDASPAVPAYDQDRDLPATTVGLNWGAWQSGTRAAEQEEDEAP
ncbi:hypothetical protein [Streptomyces oceani]|uniref:Uncharacterized protein n=1 Tax=Streptomyces oceani TaxID=1075402 RepID=A0A1E7KQ26_9ACTN|nr:hypothetical protein [Streptomyces oceani]OEV06028.1 hypothetical protein AN216_00715 [Streptomyces oceani]